MDDIVATYDGSSILIPGRDLLEAIDLANIIRRLGGFEEVNDLVPGVRQDSQNCVLANTFNCDCKVDCDGDWFAFFKEEKYAAALASELGNEVEDSSSYDIYGYRIRLPEGVGEIASQFDEKMLPDKYYLESIC